MDSVRLATLAGRRIVEAAVLGCVLLGAAPAAASTWSIEAVPNPSGTIQSFLNGVSCTGRLPRCTAVGAYSMQIASYRTLAERRQRSGWQIQPTPNPSGSPITVLSGVSCRRRACTAVGHSSTSLGPAVALAERWDGGQWQIEPTPNPASPGGSSELLAVSCRARRFCMAVGDYTANPNTPTIAALAERWDGATWEVLPVPNPSGVNLALLSGVSCPRRTNCLEVGGAFSQRWNGATWVSEPVPSPPGAVFISLSAVSCAAPDACTAVGTYNTANAVLTLAERWDGTSWQLQPTPNPAGASPAVLSGVSCPTRRSCTAVGFFSTSSASFTLIERWDGTSWRIQPSPNVPGASATTLSAVSCTRRGGCTAVGTAASSAGGFALAERELP